MLSFKQERITPSKAQQLLNDTDELGFINRSLAKSNVDRYARDMQSGKWLRDTGETIKIDTSGAVIDGQNRLHAVIKADTPIEMWVCRGMDRGAFQFLDQGKPRDLQNIMQVEEYPDPRILSVAGKMLWRPHKTLEKYGEGRPYAHAGSFNESEGAIFDWVKVQKPDLRRFWDSYKPLVKRAYRGCNTNIAESLLFYCLYQWLQEDSTTAIDVFEYLGGRTDGMAAPHPAVSWAAQYADDLKTAQRTTGAGGTRGRHADSKESILLVLNITWEILRHQSESRAWSKRKYVTFKRFCVEQGAYPV